MRKQLTAAARKKSFIVIALLALVAIAGVIVHRSAFAKETAE